DHRDGQAYLQRPDGGHCAIEFSAVPIRDTERAIVGAVIVFNDISEDLRIRNQLAYQAEHDALTGLGNRYRFETEAENLIQSAKRDGGVHTLLYMDLDQFKIVNDTCGHHAGDQLLRQLAVVIVNQVRHDDLVARLGGDEFGLLLADCPPERGALIATAIIEAINEFQFHWETRTFSVGISVGLVALDGKADSTTLLKAADQACYAAKDQGRNRFQIYRSDDDALVQRSVELRAAADIDAAIRENRFELYCQHIVSLGEDPDAGHTEILLRMRSRDGQLISPGEFLPGAERYGKMAVIDRWVVRRVFTKMSELKSNGQLEARQRFTINLSGSTINDPGFHDYVDTLLKSSGISAANVCFEVTESSAVTNFAGASRFLQDMRTLGCRIMLDDFGSGLSSFTYLKMLPIDYLKIDGALIRDIASNPFDLAILRAIQDVARAIEVPVVAEHVQCQAVLEKLREIGIEYAQGYLLHEPEPWASGEA
ncbi:MAG: EAL domain-containing protein, partial [Wenzhouxiangella sp.]